MGLNVCLLPFNFYVSARQGKADNVTIVRLDVKSKLINITIQDYSELLGCFFMVKIKH